MILSLRYVGCCSRCEVTVRRGGGGGWQVGIANLPVEYPSILAAMTRVVCSACHTWIVMMHRLLAVFLLLMLLAEVSADLREGMAAYERGDYQAALREWRPLADQGNDHAQVVLAMMYEYGNGDPQDYAQTAKLYRLAADQGLLPEPWHLDS